MVDRLTLLWDVFGQTGFMSRSLDDVERRDDYEPKGDREADCLCGFYWCKKSTSKMSEEKQ